MGIRYVPSSVVDARHRAATALKSPAARVAEAAPRTLRNVDVVLTLGEMRYITVRHRVYRVAPVPFKLGQQILDLQIRVTTNLTTLALQGKAADATDYYRALVTLARIMWPALRPTKRWRRALKGLHLLRNPLMVASEKELLDLTNFFLQCRMTSSVQSTEARPPLTPQTRTP